MTSQYDLFDLFITLEVPNTLRGSQGIGALPFTSISSKWVAIVLVKNYEWKLLGKIGMDGVRKIKRCG